MPLLWRYLLKRYLTLFLICLAAFVGLLLVIRFQDIAVFACSGAPLKLVILFAILQVPYILPFAIPISSLISAMVLFKQLSQKHELTALRAACFNLKQLTSPLLYFAILLSLSNFILSSEIAPRCKAKAKELLYLAASENPFFILQKDSPIRIKDCHVVVGKMGPGKEAEDIAIVLKNTSSKRLSVILAKKLNLENHAIKGKNVSVISSIAAENKGSFDHLFIENQEMATTDAKNMGQILGSEAWQTHNECISFRMLLVRLLSPMKSTRLEIINEMAKRLSLSLAPLTLTLLGGAFGMQIGRRNKKISLIIVPAITAFFFMTFLSAKSAKTFPLISIPLYILPHFLVGFFAFWHLRNIQQGVE